MKYTHVFSLHSHARTMAFFRVLFRICDIKSMGLTRFWTIACRCDRSFLTTVNTSARDSVLSCWTRQLSATYTELLSEPYLNNNI